MELLVVILTLLLFTEHDYAVGYRLRRIGLLPIKGLHLRSSSLTTGFTYIQRDGYEYMYTPLQDNYNVL